jgi:hypothetical protein
MLNEYHVSPQLANCAFIGNVAAYFGGGVDNDTYCSAVLANCTFSRNTADHCGTGVHNYYSSSSTITNCILWGDSGVTDAKEIYNDGPESFPATAVVTYSCVQGGYDGTGNISIAPLFADAAHDDYTLQSGSPCIDTGTSDGAPDTDILGVARPQGSGYDMGAYEYAGR